MFSTVLDIPLFSNLDVRDKASFESKFVERRLSKQQVLFHQGDPGHEMFIIKSGSLQIFLHEEEHLIVVGHQFPGETIGELEVLHYENRRLASVSALENSIVWSISRVDLDELFLVYPELLRKFLFVLSERLAQADRTISYLAFLDTRLRVVNLLLDLYSNFGKQVDDEYVIDWKVTQQHLANMIGVNRESATRALHGLRSEGILRIQGRTITILDLVELQRMAVKPNAISARQWHSTYRYNTGNV